MPRIGSLVAQRVRYPNGGLSDPFIVSMNKHDLGRFARRIIEDRWGVPPQCLTPEGRVDPEKLAAARAADDFDSGSARLCCAFEGRFWQTAKILHRECRLWDVQIGNVIIWPRPGVHPIPGDSADRRLSDGEMSILFGLDDEYGWIALKGLGITEPVKALARTVLAWLPHIEEWSE